VSRRPDRSVGLDGDLGVEEARNPELRSADRPLIEGLQSGDLVATSSVHPGTGIKTKEKAEADKRYADLVRNIALTAISTAVPAMRVIQMNRALQAAVAAARATPAGQGLAQALTRNTPMGTSPATPFGWGARDSALQHGFAGGSVGSGLLPSTVPMLRYGEGAEEHFYGLVGDMYEVGDPDSTWPFPESWFPGVTEENRHP